MEPESKGEPVVDAATSSATDKSQVEPAAVDTSAARNTRKRPAQDDGGRSMTDSERLNALKARKAELLAAKAKLANKKQKS